MQTNKKIVMVDKQTETYIKGKNASELEETKDFNQATHYPLFLLSRNSLLRKAKEKFGKKFEFKTYIAISGNIDIAQDLFPREEQIEE